MADFPYNEASKYTTYGAVESGSIGTTVTAGSANTKGSWAEITASTTYPAAGLLVNISINNFASTGLMDVGIGAAGSETVIIPNIFIRNISGTGNPSPTYTLYFPIQVPAGTRLSMRAQASVGSTVYRCVILALSAAFASFPGYSKCAAGGVDTSTSNATTITTNSVAANTKSAYTELIASTTFPIKAILCYTGTVAATNSSTLVDLAVGAAGSEQVVLSNIGLLPDTTNEILGHYIPTIPLSIPAGSRIAWREASSVTSGTFLVQFAFYGVG